jgi:hypothetical protein
MRESVNKNKKKYIIGGMYHHPNQNVSAFKHRMDDLMAEIVSCQLTCIIAGDTNIDSPNRESNRDIC